MPSDLVLITGATGHVGFHVLLETLKSGYSVRAAVRSESSSKVQKIKASKEIAALGLAPDTLSFITVPDFLAQHSFDEAVKGVKYIIHVASPIPKETMDTDYENVFIKPAVRATFSVLEAAEKEPTVEKIVVTSSVIATVPASVFAGGDPTVYSANSRIAFVPGPYDHPMFAYGASKVAALNQAEDWYRERSPKFSLIHVHPGLVLGPDLLVNSKQEMLDAGSNSLVLKPLTGNPGQLFEGSVHVTDVAKVHVGALKPEVKGLKSFGASIGVDYNEILPVLERDFAAAIKDGQLVKPSKLEYARIQFDSAETEKVLGIKFRGVEEQLKGLLEYYVQAPQTA